MDCLLDHQPTTDSQLLLWCIIVHLLQQCPSSQFNLFTQPGSCCPAVYLLYLSTKFPIRAEPKLVAFQSWCCPVLPPIWLHSDSIHCHNKPALTSLSALLFKFQIHKGSCSLSPVLLLFKVLFWQSHVCQRKQAENPFKFLGFSKIQFSDMDWFYCGKETYACLLLH